MLSRVAENLYWMGRYLERSESVARLADVNFHANVEQLPAGGGDAWDAVVDALDARVAYDEAVASQPGLRPSEFVIYSLDNPKSLLSTITSARNLGRELREYISREVFEEINRLYLEATRAGSSEHAQRTLFASVRRTIAAILGFFDNTVLYTEGREWFRCGLFVERADMVTRIIDAKYFILLPSVEDVGGPLDRYQWLAILRSGSALEAYRKRHRGAITGPRVAELLMFDAEFPRSLVFCVEALRNHYERATQLTPRPRAVHAAREIGLLELDLRSANASNVIRHGLHEFLDGVQLRLNRIGAAMTDHVFRALPEEPERDRLGPLGNHVQVQRSGTPAAH